MPIEITMPRLSDTMEQGTIVSWNVAEGAEVSAGDVLGDIETDKATMELQSFDDGIVAVLLLAEGQTVDVGAPILVLAEEGENPAEVRSAYTSHAHAGAGGGNQGHQETASSGLGIEKSDDSGASFAAEGPVVPTNGHASAPGDTPGAHGRRIFASPLARKIASEKGLDLAQIRGTGPSGRITKKDVETAAVHRPPAPPIPVAAVPTPAPPSELAAATVPGQAAPIELPAIGGLADRVVPLSNMRRTIAKRLVESKQTIPHYEVTVAARMDALMTFRKQLNEQLVSQGVKLSVNDFLVRACALAMHQHPFVNASWGNDGGSINLHGSVNIGVAIALPIKDDLTGGGLVVGVLHNTDRMGLRLISDTTKQLATKARTRGLAIEEMEGSTFTISNLGMFGVEHFTAIINPPNSAILSVGAAVKKPVVGEDGELTVGHEMSMTMASDHRVIDGAMAAQYLATVKQMLESPATLLV